LASIAAALRVHKFGGSSLADAERIRRAIAIVGEEAPVIVVVSAMRGVTDALLSCLETAAAGTDGWREMLAELAERHRRAATALLAREEARTALLRRLDDSFAALAQVLSTCAMLRAAHEAFADYVSGLGEVWSASLFHAAWSERFADAAMLDARQVLVAEPAEGGASVDWAESARRFAAWREREPSPRVVATGFIAADRRGRALTLGRNGSDYSAAIFAALADARECLIWTDTDGVLSADPQLVPEAVSLPALSYEEACELAYFGAKVLHPRTLAPAMAKGFPVVIRNSFRPEHPGSRISADAPRGPGPVRGLSLSRGLSLLELTGTGMIGVPGTAERLFGALHRAGISVVMISQGSSEHSICCLVRAEQAARAKAAVDQAFALELARGEVQAVRVTEGIAALTAVGEGMAGTPGVAARLFASIAQAGVNVRAIAQGSSERSISVAVAETEAARALRAAHAAFWLSPTTISVGVVGAGQVGRAFIAQLLAAAPRLRERAGLDLRLRAVANSRRMWLDPRGVEVSDWAERLRDGCACDLEALAAHVRAEHLPHALIVDCTASEEPPQRYASWLRQGIHVVTANKLAGAGPWSRLEAIRAAARQAGTAFRYEATVGAGLPVIQTLRDLIDSGDQLIAIEGLLSGTLAWLFSAYDGQRPFSALLREAQRLGYTEPDPREDLSGRDVARKLVILAREAGLRLSPEEVAVESLVPAALASLPLEVFLARLEELDPLLAARRRAASSQGRVLRYLARLDAERGQAEVKLAELSADHPAARASGSDNLVRFITRRYREQPLIVQGPGAGPEVTAAGVFADVLRIAQSLGARL
jgi:aspartokinase/homoserine dehydrogenase 1